MKMGKIAIIGDKEITSSLYRAFRYIDYLRHTLITRFVLAEDINDAIKLCNREDIVEKTPLSNFSLLILVNKKENDNLSLIRDIRFSTKKNLDSPGIPIVLLATSIFSVDNLVPDKTGYLHLRNHGTALSIPFILKSLNDCLKRVVYFDNELLSDVKGSFDWRAWVHEILHNMDENNYRGKMKFLVEKIAPDDCKEKIRALESMTYSSARQKLEEIIREGNCDEKL